MRSEVLTGPERRRRWSAAEKARLVAEMAALGSQVAEIARRHGVSRSLLYAWRRASGGQGAEARQLGLVPAVVVAETATGHAPEIGTIEIPLPGGVHVTVRGRVDAKGLHSVLAALQP